VKELLLGRHTPVVEIYSPELLYPIPRSEGRAALDLPGAVPFYGVDIWYAYEMSWLDDTGRPVVRVGRFTIPATSENIVESKSFKLYLNSLNSSTFGSEEDAINCIEADISAITGEAVHLELFLPDDIALQGHILEGICLDGAGASIGTTEPRASQIERSGVEEIVEEKLFSHLLRSLCPVTGQPDWATVWVHYRGLPLDHASLLGYIIAYRQHQEFHEQCVERMFCDIQTRSEAQYLHIQAFYTRRGGLDISPFRSTQLDAQPQPRLNRQ
jgi:7-cyano-7-deazaguanine reductase